MSTQLETMTAADLLGIGTDQPERLFSADEADARGEYRSLRSRWHPDRNPDRQAGWVFAHVADLYRAAQTRRAAGIWDSGRRLDVRCCDGRRFRLTWQWRTRLDVGHAYVGRHAIAFMVAAEHADLAAHAAGLLGNLPFADDVMRAEMARKLPALHTVVPLPDGASLLVMRKHPEFVPLRQLLACAGGSLDVRHVAWITSALLDLSCYLQHAGLVHQAIDIDHLLVAPQHHAVCLAGGWWYAAREHACLLALPARSARCAPPDILHRRIADRRLDQWLVRTTALELLGAATDMPAPLHAFLTTPGNLDAVADYAHWQRALWDSFGERRFTPLPITADDVYRTAS